MAAICLRDLATRKLGTGVPGLLVTVVTASQALIDAALVLVLHLVALGGCGFDDDGSPIDMGDPTDWQTPRRYEVGFRVEF